MLIDTRSVQRFLKAKGLYGGDIDGDYGLRSQTAARRAIGETPPARTTYRYPGWSDDRVRIGVEQLLLAERGFYPSKIDGIPGPATQVALEKWQDFITFKRKSPNPSAGVPTTSAWPRQAGVSKFFGKVGENQVRLVSPYPLYLDWDLTDSLEGFRCHEKIHGAALRVMVRVLDAYGPDKIHELGLDQFGGCLNVRKMRNGSAWSMHAWGIAIDWDADRNTLRETSRTARMARPEYSRFLDLWEQEGFISLGRARNFDWMHVQAARL